MDEELLAALTADFVEHGFVRRRQRTSSPEQKNPDRQAKDNHSTRTTSGITTRPR